MKSNDIIRAETVRQTQQNNKIHTIIYVEPLFKTFII